MRQQPAKRQPMRILQRLMLQGITGNSTDGYTVTGTAEPGSKVEIKDSTGAVIGSVTADGSGNYSVTLPASVAALPQPMRPAM